MGKIKICGLKTTKDIKIVNNLMPDYIGFILAPSKRQIDFDLAKKLKGLLNPSIKAVGVFVNEKPEEIRRYVEAGIIDCIQLHGDEDLAYIEALKKENKQQLREVPIIKALRVKDEVQFQQLAPFIEAISADFLLFDTYQKSLYGGSGKSFDWQLLKNIKKPYFLAGGIGIHNLEDACKLEPFAIDVSSMVETEGVKDEEKVRALIEKWRKRERSEE